jgi:hypothetical protein
MIMTGLRCGHLSPFMSLTVNRLQTTTYINRRVGMTCLQLALGQLPPHELYGAHVLRPRPLLIAQ